MRDASAQQDADNSTSRRRRATDDGLRLSGHLSPRVLVVHRTFLVAEVLSRRLSEEPLLQSVSVTSDLEAALERLAEVDLVVVDGSARLASGAGFAATVLTVPDHPGP